MDKEQSKIDTDPANGGVYTYNTGMQSGAQIPVN